MIQFLISLLLFVAFPALQAMELEGFFYDTAELNYTLPIDPLFPDIFSSESDSMEPLLEIPLIEQENCPQYAPQLSEPTDILPEQLPLETREIKKERYNLRKRENKSYCHQPKRKKKCTETLQENSVGLKAPSLPAVAAMTKTVLPVDFERVNPVKTKKIKSMPLAIQTFRYTANRAQLNLLDQLRD